MRLQGKVALVTGAASGIGHAVSELFAREGATVFASDIASPATPYSDGIQIIPLDVTSEGDWKTAVDVVVKKTGRLDVLINNAGIIAYEPLHELDMTAWMKMIAVDQTGVFLGMREAIRVMRPQKSGSIASRWLGLEVRVKWMARSPVKLRSTEYPLWYLTSPSPTTPYSLLSPNSAKRFS